MLAIVNGDARLGEDLVLHGAPLGMTANVIDVTIDRRHQGIVAGLGEQLVKAAVPFGEAVGVAMKDKILIEQAASAGIEIVRHAPAR